MEENVKSCIFSIEFMTIWCTSVPRIVFIFVLIYQCTGGLAGEGLSMGASGAPVSGGVQEAGISDLSRVNPGPADSAVAAGSGESAAGSELESLVEKVGCALVSCSSEPPCFF